MKIITAVSAAALLALSAPAFAQSTGTTTNGMPNNGSPNAMGGAHQKQPGAADTQSGGMTEGRSSVTDPTTGTTGGTGAMIKNGETAPGSNGNMAPGGGPGESGGGAK